MITSFLSFSSGKPMYHEKPSRFNNGKVQQGNAGRDETEDGNGKTTQSIKRLSDEVEIDRKGGHGGLVRGLFLDQGDVGSGTPMQVIAHDASLLRRPINAAGDL